MFGTVLLGSYMSCRNVALICFYVPVITTVLVYFVCSQQTKPIHRKSIKKCIFFIQIPESPHWLLARHRSQDALESLQWLRGWVSPQSVEKEFNELKRYHKRSGACIECDKSDVPCPHPPSTFVEKCRDLLRKRVLKPAIIVIIISFFAQFAGFTSMRPYLVLTLKAYGVPIDPHRAAVS